MSGGSYRVLVVDDDPLLRRLYTRALERLAVDAVVVAAGAGAEAAAREKAFTLALIDWNLVGESGSDVVRRIVNVQALPPRFVCISGSVAISEQSPPPGFHGVDKKPATVAEMQEVLARWA